MKRGQVGDTYCLVQYYAKLKIDMQPFLYSTVNILFALNKFERLKRSGEANRAES